MIEANELQQTMTVSCISVNNVEFYSCPSHFV